MNSYQQPEPDKILCRMEQLEAGAARGCEVLTGGRQRSVLVYYDGESVRAYWNACPHTGVRLDWREHDFMDLSGQYLQCAMHGALFETGSGLCVNGPCYGQHLKPAKITVADGLVCIDED